VSTALVWGVVLVVASGLIAAPALRRRDPRTCWFALAFPALWLRMRTTWKRLAAECDLTVTRGARTALVGKLMVKGRELDAIVPHLVIGLPRPFALTARVALLPGQTPEDFAKAAEAMTHAWRVHSVRVTSPARGWVHLAVWAADPLTDTNAASSSKSSGHALIPRQRGPVGGGSVGSSSFPEGAAVLLVRVGRREDGQPWLLDLRLVPHWLVTGATRSGKSTLINALITQLAPRPVALVGIDLKGGLELSAYLPRLSALATTRAETADLLDALSEEMAYRMRQCQVYGARSIWELPALVRPVPVVVIVDEIAEVYLVADKSEKAEAAQCSVLLVRIAQLGAALGLHLIVAGQRVGSDLGDGVTALRAQLGGRICHRVTDPATAVMTLGDVLPDAVDAAQMITPSEKGVAITTDENGAWLRARSDNIDATTAQDTARRYAHLRPSLPVLDHWSGIEDTGGEPSW
jgi:S-DNA-T family DNA segregation ATPase FtsK/SpoIIIE